MDQEEPPLVKIGERYHYLKPNSHYMPVCTDQKHIDNFLAMQEELASKPLPPEAKGVVPLKLEKLVPGRI